MKATYGTGFKAPTLTELYVNFPAFNSVANPNLAPEKSTGFDVGFEQSLLHDQVAFGATYFHNDITNLIVGTFDPVTFISSFANVGQATTQGVEAFAAGIVNPRLRLRADYTYTEARDDTTGLALLRRPVNKASLSAIWYPIEKMTVTTTFLHSCASSDPAMSWRGWPLNIRLPIIGPCSAASRTCSMCNMRIRRAFFVPASVSMAEYASTLVQGPGQIHPS